MRHYFFQYFFLFIYFIRKRVYGSRNTTVMFIFFGGLSGLKVRPESLIQNHPMNILSVTIL